ncbi:MAG: peptidylprolyl isomerase [Cyclobacteriaceae bacterium]|nr:peptidylprolyl isomerase [Cyclobacteriaceae bacterium]
MRLLTLLTILGLLASCQPAGRDSFEVGQIKTPQGEILLWLYENTPHHRESFIELANAGYWDSLTFNRVIPNFVAQGGCPDTPEGFNDPEYLLKPEFVPSLRHEYGALGAGRDANPEKLSARCQFYIVQNKDGVHRLDGDYTVFGKVIKGMDVIDTIVNVERDSTDQPLIPVTLDVNIVNMTKQQLTDIGFEVPTINSANQ